MSKKPRLREPFDKQNGRRVHALLKCASQHLYQIDWSLPSYLSSKTSLLLTCQILGLLFNILAADEKCPVLNRENLTIRIKMQLSEKQKTFSIIFNAFLKCRLNFQYFETKDDPNRFWIFEITDSENMVRQISKKSHFRGPFDKEHGKRVQALLKSASQHFYHIHWSLPSQLSLNSGPLLTCQILVLLGNTLAADKKYRLLNRDNITITIQTQLSQKQKTFSQFFASFFKSRGNFEHFDKENDPRIFCYFEITDSENLVG